MKDFSLHTITDMVPFILVVCFVFIINAIITAKINSSDEKQNV